MKNLNLLTIVLSICLFFLAGYYTFIKLLFWKKLKAFENKVPEFQFKFAILPRWFTLAKICLILGSVILVVISLMNPHLSRTNEKEEKLIQGVDIIFVVDVSLSMYAVDLPPNRLTRFKEILLSLLPELQGNRLGLITFAGSSFLYCPMTSDISAFSDYVRGLDVDIIPDKGTNLLKALKKTEEILKSKKIQKNKLVVLVTDGEDQSASLYKLNFPLMIWGVGTTRGGVIFYKDETSNISGYVSKDRKLYPNPNDGQVILSHLEESYLKKLALKNDGDYLNLSVESNLGNKILTKLNSIEKNANQVLQDALKKDGYFYFLTPALILMLLEITLLEISSQKFQKKSLKKLEKTVV